MSRKDAERTDYPRARSCTVIETKSPVGYYIRTPEGAVITNHGYPLTHEEAERWLDEDEEAHRA